LERGTEARVVGHSVNRTGSIGALALGLAVGLVATAAGLAAARADASEAAPRAEVAPGVYLASASSLGSTGPAPRSATPREAAPTPQIVGGRPTTIARWPWQISISYLPIDPDNAFRSHNCGGSLVAPRIVVTAAHCMTLGPNRNFRPPEEFRVVAGRTKLSTAAGEEHAIADYFWFVDEHGTPLWDPETLEWDVVFLLLASSSQQRTIKLAGADEAIVWAPGRRAFATGWGSTIAGTDAEMEDVDKSDVLRQARLRMISDSVCDSIWGPVFVSDMMVCAGDLAGGVDVCFGDSGGPLVVPIQGGGHRLVGDVSFGDGCGLPDRSGVYGRLASDPIRSALQNGIEMVAGVDVVGAGAMPAHGFSFGPRSRKPRRGATRLVVRVPGRGKVLVHRTPHVRGASAFPRQAGPARLLVRARGKAQRRLNRQGTARVRARVTYTPMGGEPRTKSIRLRLVKRLT
jgi:hypothetical protein